MGINPGEASIRKGLFAERWPSTFPSGQGSDLAGIVEELGAEVKDVAVGDEVIGFSNNRSSQAEFVVVEAEQPCAASSETFRGSRRAASSWPVPRHMPQCGASPSARVRRSSSPVRRVESARSPCSWPRMPEAMVIGVAGEANHKWLTEHDVIPVTYGDGIEERIRGASGRKVDAFIDTYGGGYVELALKLGVAQSRIDTIIDFAAAAKYGVKTEGNHEAANADVLAQLAGLLAAGRLEIPIANVYPLAEVREAYRELEQRHTRGKIVLEP